MCLICIVRRFISSKATDLENTVSEGLAAIMTDCIACDCVRPWPALTRLQQATRNHICRQDMVRCGLRLLLINILGQKGGWFYWPPWAGGPLRSISSQYTDSFAVADGDSPLRSSPRKSLPAALSVISLKLSPCSTSLTSRRSEVQAGRVY